MSIISPDAVAPVDLTLFDRSAEDLRTLGLTDAAARLPEWTPREGNVEVVLLDAMALIISELIYATNRIPTAVRDSILTLLGVTRDPGAPATVDVTFNLADTTGHTIPTGTRVRLDTQGTSWVFALDVDAVAVPGENTATAAATATIVGSTPNGVASGTALAPVDQPFYVDSAVTATTVASGRDPEDQAAFEARALQVLALLSQVLVTADQFTAAALTNPAVQRALTIETYDGAGGPPYTDSGHVTVVVRGPSGNVSSPDKAALAADLQGRVVAGVIVHVIDPTITSVAVTASVAIRTGFVEADVLAAVEAALGDYLSPSTWPWEGVVRRNELISLIDGVAGVDYVASLTVPASDLTLSGDGPLANAGTLTITGAA